jgi:hypothetical protein
MGTNWYAAMMTPQVDGTISPGGALDGGHAYLSHGINQKVGTKVCTLNRNSWNGWGTIAGKPGDFYLANADAFRLLDQEGGECGMAVKLPQPRHASWLDALKKLRDKFF